MVFSRAAALSVLLFILLGLAFIPYPGLEDDELFFAQTLFPAWQHTTMLASYVGSLKTQLYWPVFRIFDVGIWSVRLPMLLLGALTIWIFFQLAWLGAGRVAAILAAVLLATHPSFLLTTVLDRGPVVLVQFLLVTGCYLLVRFAGDAALSRRDLALAAAFFCFGLATWTKAVFGWLLGGLAVAGVAVFWTEVWRAFRPRNIVIAAAAFLLGALPLIVFNVRHVNATLGGNVGWEGWQGIAGKWAPLRNVSDGSLFAEDFVSPETAPGSKPADSLRGRLSAWIRDHLGEHRRTGFVFVFAALLAAVPWWRRSRAAWYSLLFVAVAWLIMAATRRAGVYSAHIILLWPFPVLFVASALAALPWRRLAVGTVAVMVGMNLLVLTQYIAQYERNGPDERFTDAIFPPLGRPGRDSRAGDLQRRLQRCQLPEVAA